MSSSKQRPHDTPTPAVAVVGGILLLVMMATLVVGGMVHVLRTGNVLSLAWVIVPALCLLAVVFVLVRTDARDRLPRRIRGTAPPSAPVSASLDLPPDSTRVEPALRLPTESRNLLLAHCDHYVRVPASLRTRFESQIARFVADHRVTGVEVDVDEAIRLLVAASAVTLTVGWPEFRWVKLTEVLVYPSDFASDYSFDDPELAGRTHPWGIVLLSVPSLRKSFAAPHDGYHVGIHEFAHLLDLAGGEFDGVPVGMKPDRIPTWLDLVERERRRVWRTRHALRSYGAMSPAEFLAVAAEAFFENPRDVRRRHPDLYGLLAEYFQQDPAAWDDARDMDANRSQAPSA